MNFQGVIFDFDGVIIDTEFARYTAMKQIFETYGQCLPLHLWIKNIGNASYVHHPFEMLRDLIGNDLDFEELKRLHKSMEVEIVDTLPVLPGVLKKLNEIRYLGGRIAIASSSSRVWVESHLKKRELLHYFDALVCRDDTTFHKPHPEPYLNALKKIQCNANGAFAFEDSPAGIQAAKEAGLFCIGVGCSLTKNMDLSRANIVIQSLEHVSFAELSKLDF